MKINLTEFDLNVRRNGSAVEVFDRLRKKYVPLTPEENVRQLFVEFLVNQKGYPSGLMNNEIEINQNGIKRRCDTLVFDRRGNPIMIIEYKAPTITISQKVFNQIYRYNTVLKVKYLIVSNGIDLYCCVNDYQAMTCRFIEGVPMYDEL